MDSATPPPDLYERLIAISQEAAAAALYEVAYHTLVAALHCADTAGNSVRLHEVLTLAATQRTRLLTQAPDHLLTPQASAARGTHNIYDSLELQGQAMLTRLRSKAALAQDLPGE